jgi:hypothetical protein
MLTDSEQQRAMENCDRVRGFRRVHFLQVMSDPQSADNVQIRIGQGPWQTLHVLDAIAITYNAYRKQRKWRQQRKKRRKPV